MTLSVVIIAQDEERTIGRVLDAVKPIADEMILVDSGSSDGTREIATEHGAHVTHQDWLGYAAQKNFALGLAKGDWVLSLDADEVLTPELVEEIATLLKDASAKDFLGYRIPRALYIGDVRVAHGGFYPDAQLRLIQKGAGLFNDRLVHEAIHIDGPVGMLRAEMHHYAYKNVQQFEDAMEKYARLSAREFVLQGRSGWRAHPVNEIFHPIWTFFYRYLLRGGCLDGALGFRLATIYSDYVRRKIRYFREELRTVA